MDVWRIIDGEISSSTILQSDMPVETCTIPTNNVTANNSQVSSLAMHQRTDEGDFVLTESRSTKGSIQLSQPCWRPVYCSRVLSRNRFVNVSVPIIAYASPLMLSIASKGFATVCEFLMAIVGGSFWVMRCD